MIVCMPPTMAGLVEVIRTMPHGQQKTRRTHCSDQSDSAIMPHAALSPLCRIPDYAESKVSSPRCLGLAGDYLRRESIRHNRGRLQASQKPEKLIIRLVTKTSAIRRCGFAEGPFFHCKVGVEIDLCSLDGFVSEPQCDHGSVDPCLKQFHCSGVSKHVWAYSPCIESLAIVFGCECVFCDQVLNRIGAQSTSSTIRKQYLRAFLALLAIPFCEHRGSRFRQRGTSFLASLSFTSNMGASAKDQVLMAERRYLR